MANAQLYAVGIDRYDHYRDLKCCSHDAEELLHCFGRKYARSTQRLLTTASIEVAPTAKSITTLLDEIATLRLGADDVVLFAFAGHGFHEGGRDYLVCRDSRHRDPGTAIPTADVLAALTDSGAGRPMLFVDACRDDSARDSQKFGEETAELARRRGVTAFFGCSPGEVCYELASELGHGVFTYAVLQFVNNARDITPLLLDSAVRDLVASLCKAHKLGKQTPYTTVLPLQKAVMDIFTGMVVVAATKPWRTAVILGLPYAGKTSLARHLSQQEDGAFQHAEMSAYLWKRFNEYRSEIHSREDERPMSKSVREFVAMDVWMKKGKGVLAEDLLAAHQNIDRLVVTGPRTVEEVETLRAARGDLTIVFVYASARTRYERYMTDKKEIGQTWSFDEFVRNDMREYGWGLAHLASNIDTHIILNESNSETAGETLTGLITRNNRS